MNRPKELRCNADTLGYIQYLEQRLEQLTGVNVEPAIEYKETLTEQ